MVRAAFPDQAAAVAFGDYIKGVSHESDNPFNLRSPGSPGNGQGPMTPFPREDYRPLQHYVPNRSPIALDLSDNTNLWGAHPAALER